MQGDLFEQANRLQSLPMEDADVSFMEGFYSAEVASRYFECLLAESNWRQETLRLWGKSIEQPRLSAWYGDADNAYSYSGIRLHPQPWTPLLLKIKQDIEAATGDHFNSVLLNLYRNEQDSVSWHSDDEAELGLRPVIASLSLGETRRFKFRHKASGRLMSVPLSHGCLLRMAGETQHGWKHAVPKEKLPKGSRINLTFRHIRSTP